jgi:hypothetical protein
MLLVVNGDGEGSYGWSALLFLVFYFFVSCKLWNAAFLLLLSIPMVLGVILCLLVLMWADYNAWCELLLHYLL